MPSLWQSLDPAAWATVLEAYTSEVDATSNEKLQALDTWYTTELQDAVRSRSPPHLTKEEVVKLVDWKLTRGKWRPRLLDYAKQADAAAVQAATRQAFQQLDGGSSKEQQVSAALKQLCQLKGVGPATASAMLALVDSSCPFMSDEALNAVLGSRDYTAPAYMRLAKAMQAKAAELSQLGARQWSAAELERCLWAEARHGKAAAGTSKRGNAEQAELAGTGASKKRRR